MRLHGDFNESKSHRFLVRLFGAIGAFLVYTWATSYISNLAGFAGQSSLSTAIYLIGIAGVAWYLVHEWRESNRIEKEFERALQQHEESNEQNGDSQKEKVS